MPRLHPGRSRSNEINERFLKRKLHGNQLADSKESNFFQKSSKRRTLPIDPPTPILTNPQVFDDFLHYHDLPPPTSNKTLHVFFSQHHPPDITPTPTNPTNPTSRDLYILASLLRPNSAQWNILVNNVRQSLQSRPLLYAPAQWVP